MPASSRRILFVERDESLRLLLQRVLLRCGIAADATGEAPDAILQLAREKYQVVVIDLAATGGGAYEVVRALSLIAPVSRPVVIATGDPVDDMRLDAEVISLVVRKPYDVQALAEIINASMTVGMSSAEHGLDERLPLC